MDELDYSEPRVWVMKKIVVQFRKDYEELENGRIK